MKLPRIILTGSVIASVFAGSLLLVSPKLTEAQTEGNNTVWNTSIQGSAAYIDASAFTDEPGGPYDICQILYHIIKSDWYAYPTTTGAVIDARGIYAGMTNVTNDGHGDLVCAGTPWSDAGIPTTHPATILLPAGYAQGCTGCGDGNIIISQTWVLPNGSKIIGEGPNGGATSSSPPFASHATLQAIPSGFTGTAMIQMGGASSPTAWCPSVNGSPVCTGVAVEHITLEGSTSSGSSYNSINGIDNTYSVGSSYVNDVRFADLGGTGLTISAPSSGPYSDLYYATGAPCNTTSHTCPACVKLQAGTLGIHGITCVGSNKDWSMGGGTSNAAIYVNASDNSVADVHIEGFEDGVRIGDVASGTVANVVVSNVTGTHGGSGNLIDNGQVLNTIHICGSNSNGTFGACPNTTTSTTISDVAIFQATDSNNSVNYPTPVLSTTIQDDVTGTTIAPVLSTSNCPSSSSGPICSPMSVAEYVLGERVGGNNSGGSPLQQYSRFGTSPSFYNFSGTKPTYSTPVPTWLSGNASVVSGSTDCYDPGALYSYTSGGSGSAIFVCTWNSSGFLKWTDLI